MRITIRFGEPLRRVIGRHRLQIELQAGSTLADLLSWLYDNYPKFADSFAGEGLGHHYPYHLFQNHRHILPEQWPHTALADGDVIHIIIPVLGGQA